MEDRLHGYLFSWCTPTSPSLPPCPRGDLDFGAGCFSECPVAAAPTSGGIPEKLGPGVCVYQQPGDSGWVGVSPS